MSTDLGTHSTHSIRLFFVYVTSTKFLNSFMFEAVLSMAPTSSSPRLANSSWKMSTVSFVWRASSAMLLTFDKKSERASTCSSAKSLFLSLRKWAGSYCVDLFTGRCHVVCEEAVR